jgi:glycosyltransferase involved in cell wall biosynthesis
LMARSLRILQVSDLYEPFIGGAERLVKTLSEGLAQRGHNVTVATTRLPGTMADETAGGVRIQRITGWSTRILSSSYERAEAPFHPPMPDPGVVVALNAIIDDLRPDIVHAHGWITYSCMVARLKQSRLIVTLHDYAQICARKTLLLDGKEACPGPRLDHCLRCAPGQYGAAKGLALTSALRMARPLHGRVDSWITTSRFVADSTSPWLPRGTPIEVIPAASIDAAPSTRVERPSWVPPDDYLLFVGALGRHKGLHWLLDAHAQGGLPPLVVIGTPSSDTPRTWPDNVVVRTNVSHRDVMAAWGHARLGIVPSLWPEPFGLVAVEAMCSGIPVVASRIGGLPEIVVDGVTGILVTPGDTTELRAALLRLDRSPALSRAMGEAGRSRAAVFAPANFVDSHERHYHQLAGGHVANVATQASCMPFR